MGSNEEIEVQLERLEHFLIFPGKLLREFSATCTHGAENSRKIIFSSTSTWIFPNQCESV